MPPLSRDALNELARLAEKVPRGPWRACTCGKGCGQLWDTEHDVWVATVESSARTQDKGFSAEQQEDTMAFLVALVNAAPALIETAQRPALPSHDALVFMSSRVPDDWDGERFDAAEREVEAWLRARLEEAQP